MRKHIVRAGLIGVMLQWASGCAVTATVPMGAVVYEPPVVVEEPAVAVFGFWPWPHYEVEHHYRVEDEHVVIHDRHYVPALGRSPRYI